MRELGKEGVVADLGQHRGAPDPPPSGGDEGEDLFLCGGSAGGIVAEPQLDLDPGRPAIAHDYDLLAPLPEQSGIANAVLGAPAPDVA